MSWETVKLEKIKAPQRYSLVGGPFGSNLVTRDYVEQGVPVIRGTNLSGDFRFSLDDLVFVSGEKADELLPNNAYPGDVVFTQRGTLGQIGIIPKNCGYERFVISQSQMKLTVDENQAEPFFVYYFFKSAETVQKIHNLAFSSGVPHINLQILREFEIPLPPLPTQRRIADILSAYDDLIENNTRRIRILEQMAQAIYQEWFGKVDKESMPKGWELKSFSDLVNIDPTTPVAKEIEKPFVGMNALSETLMIIDTSLIEMRTGNSGARFQNRDVLFPRITPSVENGKGAFVQFLNDGQVSIGSTEIIVFREKELNAEYIYFLSREHEFRGNAINSMVGASGRQRVQQKCFDGFMVAKPPKKLLEKYADVVSPMFKITHTLALKNANLRQTRDLLLPRLVSGEIDV